LFLTQKELADMTMTLTEFDTKREGVIRNLTQDDFARAFERWLEWCEKCG
jgi:hypothetical protein